MFLKNSAPGKRSASKRSLQVFSSFPPQASLLAVLALLVNSACQTAPTEKEIKTQKRSTERPQEEKTFPPKKSDFNCVSIFAQVSELEQAFTKDNCKKVMDLASEMRSNFDDQALQTMPAMSAFAIEMCAVKTSTQPPLERSLLLSVLQKAGIFLNKEIFDSMGSDSSSVLNENDMLVLKQVIYNIQYNTRLLETTKELEQLIGKEKGKESRKLLIRLKSITLGKLEAAFLLDLNELSEKKAERPLSEVQAFGEELKKRYPLPTFETRINALIMDQEKPAITVTTQPGNVLNTPPLGTPEPLDEASSVEKAMQEARNAMNSGDAEKAVNILSAIPENLQNEKTRRLKKEASEKHVKELRDRIRVIYSRINAQTPKDVKITTLTECKTLLELILTRYPDISSKPGIERNLKNITSELDFLLKGK